MARRQSSSSSSAPSQRQLRVGELVRHALSDVLTRGDLADPELEGRVITVPEVRLSPDLKVATVFVMPLGGGGERDVVKALARNARWLRGAIAPRLELKFMPELRFRIDESFDEAGRIESLLRSPQVARDLGGSGGEET